MLLARFDPLQQDQFAFLVLGKLTDREEKYIYGVPDNLMRIYNNFLFHFRNENIHTRTPMFHAIEKFEYMNFQLNSVFFTIVFFLFMIDGILIYSMMLNDVEERTYEFAMLRTLGFRNQSLIVLLVIQALFQSVPATTIGFILLYIFTQATQVGLFVLLGV